jgi:hypothetical protein
MEYTRFEPISRKNHPELSEKWVQDRLAEDPSILGLGDLILKDQERIQPRAGRLDLLLQDSEASQRFEVELQLGSTDESNLIRALEYWDIERKRYPQYDHTAVIVAEDITSRFLSVISLFNGTIPLVAIQMRALKNQNDVGLFFTTVLDQVQLGLVDDDEEIQEVTDRAYWESRGTENTVSMADTLLEIAREFDDELELKYNKFYIGLARHGVPSNFIIFRPQKGMLRIEPKIPRTAELQAQLEEAGMDLLDYDTRWSRYRIRLKPEDISDNDTTVRDLIKRAYEYQTSR